MSIVNFLDGSLSFPFPVDTDKIDAKVEIGCMVKNLCEDFIENCKLCKNKQTIDDIGEVAKLLGPQIPNYERIIDLKRFINLPIIFEITTPKISKKSTILSKGGITIYLFGGDWSRVNSNQLSSHLGIPAPPDCVLENIWKEVSKVVPWEDGCNDTILTINFNLRRGQSYSLDLWKENVDSIVKSVESIGYTVGYLYRCYNYFDVWKSKKIIEDKTPLTIKDEFWKYANVIEWRSEENAISPESDFETFFPFESDIIRVVLHNGSSPLQINLSKREIKYKHLWIYAKNYVMK